MYDDYAFGRKTYIIDKAGHKMPIYTKKWTFEYLSSRWAEAITDFYPVSMVRSDVKPYLTPLKDALQEMQRPSGRFNNANSKSAYIQWNLDLKDWKEIVKDIQPLPYQFAYDELWFRECFRDDAVRNEFSKKTHWRMVLIGNPDAGMFFHADVLRQSSWQIQIVGRKKWTICDPQENIGKLYQAGDVDTFNPDLEKYPKYATSKCYEGIVEPYQMVSYPRDYWHHTKNLDNPTITITGTIVDENNYDTVIEQLNAECTSQHFKWNFSKELCEDLQTKCFPWWRTRYSKENRPSRVKQCPLKEMLTPDQ